MKCSAAQKFLEWGGYAAISTTEVFIPCGGWESAAHVSSARGWGELRGKTGSFQAKPAVQLANDVRSPGAATAVGAAISADGVSDPSSYVSLSTGGSRYIRVGWLVSLTAGSTLATGSVAGLVELIHGS